MTPKAQKRTKQLGLAAIVAAALTAGAALFGLEPSAELIDQVFRLIAGGAQ